MTNTGLKRIFSLVFFAGSLLAGGRSVNSLNAIRMVYVGSLGNFEGAEELKLELTQVLRRTRTLRLAQSPAEADVVLEGRGEMWIRGYRSLSPRARANPSAAEPIYAGYLSVKAVGGDGEVLWSYLASPARVGFGSIKRELVSQAVNKLVDDISNAQPDKGTPQALAGNDTPVALKGSGATFPFPIYQDWFRSFHARHPAWTFEYTPNGSEAGVEQLAAGTVDFAGSDIPPAASAPLASAPGVRAFPTVGGAVVLIYNIPHFGGDLRVTAEIVADIYAGRIKTWNDPRLRAINPYQSLPNAPITPVHRAEGSGTTFALADYLCKQNETWRAQVGYGSRVNWPTKAEASGNEGVANFVSATPYSLGYVEFIYAFFHHLNTASIRNSAGNFVQPDLGSMKAAVNDATQDDAYPIVAFSWLIFKDALEPAKRQAITAFIEWMLTSGQKECAALGYAPLPPGRLGDALLHLNTN